MSEVEESKQEVQEEIQEQVKEDVQKNADSPDSEKEDESIQNENKVTDEFIKILTSILECVVFLVMRRFTSLPCKNSDRTFRLDVQIMNWWYSI